MPPPITTLSPSASSSVRDAVPPVPPPPTAFVPAADTQEGRAARRIAATVARMPNMRGRIPGTWTTDPTHAWSVRRADDVLSSLDRRGVSYERAVAPSPLVPVPVRIGGSIGTVGGLRVAHSHSGAPIVVSAELADRIAEAAPVLRALGVAGINVGSAYRGTPWTSFHTMGMGLDIGSFVMADGRVLNVLRDFRSSPELQSIARALADSHLFSTVLTPSYNEGHHDHFHLDIRPDDPRFYFR